MEFTTTERDTTMTTTTDRIEIRLTKFQYEEVEGLLCNIDDQNTLAYEIDSEEDFHPVWGVLDRKTKVLTVLLPFDAIDDLEYRAEWFIQEGPNASCTGCAVVGYPAARSLQSLATRIERAAQ